MVWITTDNTDLKLRRLTIVHAGSAGHRGVDATFNALRESFTSKDQRDDTRAFVASLLMCSLAQSGNKIHRRLSTTLHAMMANEVAHFDYIFLGDGVYDRQYVLVIKDDLRGYFWLEPSAVADAAHTARVPSRWDHVIKTLYTWVSDQGVHFINQVMNCLAEDHRRSHRFSVAY